MVDSTSSSTDASTTNLRPPRAPISRSRKLIYSAVVLILALGVPELAVRSVWSPPVAKVPAVGTRQFLNWMSRLSKDVRNAQPLYGTDSHLIWRLEPSSRIKSINHHYAEGGERQFINVTINEDGYRGPKATATADDKVTRILCLGDSNFFGYPLDDQDAFPSALQKTLREHCGQQNWEVVNGGVPGYTIVQGWRLYQSKFQALHFDYLLISFLNNDAWPQPQHDLDLISASESRLKPLADLVRQSRLVNLAEYLLRPPVPPERYVPRVTLDDFVAYYRMLLDDVEKSGTRVIILDYRAYDQYAPYSKALRQLAEERHLGYVTVHEQVNKALHDIGAIRKYPEQAERVQRRWGSAQLIERPYLWYFAEMHPEHLNEVGTAMLADDLRESLCQKNPAGNH